MESAWTFSHLIGYRTLDLRALGNREVSGVQVINQSIGSIRVDRFQSGFNRLRHDCNSTDDTPPVTPAQLVPVSNVDDVTLLWSCSSHQLGGFWQIKRSWTPTSGRSIIAKLLARWALITLRLTDAESNTPNGTRDTPQIGQVLIFLFVPA